MSDKPIIFSGPMVRALLNGRKTQTRRILKPPPNMMNGGRPLNDGRGSYSVDGGWKRIPYAVGDRLYVREAWNTAFASDLAPGETLGRTAQECAAANHGFACACGDGIVYRATGAQQHPVHGKALWRSPIHMPRWASRLTLTVTAVRVQRLQEITEADAVAEGIEPHGRAFTGYGRQADIWMSPYDSFASLWNSLHGPDAWAANPWVAAYSFTVQHGNIDEVSR